MQSNQQEPQRIDRREDGTVLVHSIFPTIQGEGPYAGRFALFVRLSGCNLQCPGCDTEYTSVAVPTTPHQLLSMAEGQLNPGGLVVITGGEPFRQNITPVTRVLLEYGFDVQVETNGLLYLPDFPSRKRAELQLPGVDIKGRATIVVSPKTAKIHPETARFADAYKYVLQADYIDPDDGLPTVALGNFDGVRRYGGVPTTFNVLDAAEGRNAWHPAHVARPPEGWEGPIYLQPMDEKDETKNVRNVQACVHTILTHQRYILGFQMHKAVNLP